MDDTLRDEDGQVFWMGYFGESCLWWEFEEAANNVSRNTNISIMRARWVVLRAHQHDAQWKDMLYRNGHLTVEESRRVVHVVNEDIMLRVPKSLEHEPGTLPRDLTELRDAIIEPEPSTLRDINLS